MLQMQALCVILGYAGKCQTDVRWHIPLKPAEIKDRSGFGGHFDLSFRSCQSRISGHSPWSKALPSPRALAGRKGQASVARMWGPDRTGGPRVGPGRSAPGRAWYHSQGAAGTTFPWTSPNNALVIITLTPTTSGTAIHCHYSGHTKGLNVWPRGYGFRSTEIQALSRCQPVLPMWTLIHQFQYNTYPIFHCERCYVGWMVDTLTTLASSTYTYPAYKFRYNIFI